MRANRRKGIVERAEAEIDEERRNLESDIEQQITDVSMAVARKILARDISAADDKKLIEESLRNGVRNEKQSGNDGKK